MKPTKAFKYALNMVLHAKIRSWLTILGIVIGVAAVISIVSLGDSLKTEITSQLGNLGGDLLTLRAGASRAQGFGPGQFEIGGSSSSTSTTKPIQLDNKDVQVLRGIGEIKVIETEISGRADVYYVAEKGSASITGVDPAAWYQITTSTIAQGRMLGPSDTNVIVIGGRLANSFFTKQLGINQVLTIGGRLFRIVGILNDESTSVYMPIDSASDVISDKTKGVYDTIIIKVKDESQLDNAINIIQDKLKISRHVTAKPDFSISSNKERQQQRAATLSSMTTFLTAIAAVALLVGAVGIANSMFTSVLEKTKEIGIMKAIGARNSDILFIFLLNAGLIGFIGGLLGIFFGYILSGFLPALMGGSGGILSRFGSSGSFIGLSSILAALGGSVLIGMISGVVPAYQASKLKPVDALRYE